MHFIAASLVSWLAHALVTVAAVSVVSKGNPRNTVGRALLVTLLVTVISAVFLNLFAAILIVPLLIGVVLWFAVYMGAYGLGPLQAIGVGVMQVVIGWVVRLLFSMLAGPGGGWR